MAGVRKQQLAGTGIVAGQERRGKLCPLRARQEGVIQLADQSGLVPLLHMLPQGIAQTACARADGLPVAGYIRHKNADSLFVDQDEVVKSPATDVMGIYRAAMSRPSIAGISRGKMDS